MRSTPLAPGMYLAGIGGNVVVVSAILTALVTASASSRTASSSPTGTSGCWSRWPSARSASAAVGALVATFVPNEDAAPAIINFVLFPLLFISGTFGRVDATSALGRIASVFPVVAPQSAARGRVQPACVRDRTDRIRSDGDARLALGRRSSLPVASAGNRAGPEPERTRVASGGDGPGDPRSTHGGRARRSRRAASRTATSRSARSSPDSTTGDGRSRAATTSASARPIPPPTPRSSLCAMPRTGTRELAARRLRRSS